MTSKNLSLALFLAFGIATTALAQSSHSSIHGTVLDPSGALIPKAQITVSNVDGYSRSLESDDAGVFDVADLPAGSYSVSINAAGFTPALTSVEVADDKTAQENVTLGISVSQEIEVMADAR